MRKVSEMRFLFGLATLVFLGGTSPMLRGESFEYTIFAYPGASVTNVFGINDSGEVIGRGVLSADEAYNKFVYQSGVITPVALSEAPYALPAAITNNGTILYEFGDTFLEVNGTNTTQVVLPSNLVRLRPGASGLNDSGQMVGIYAVSLGPYFYGYILNGSTFETLNVPGSVSGTFPTGINDLGEVVGYYGGLGRQGFLYDGGRYQTISVPGASSTTVDGINNLGEVVGVYPGGGFTEIGGVFSTFSAPAGFEFDNIAINDLGEIAGTLLSESDGTVRVGFVGTPVPTAPTPEPGTIGLVGTGVVALAGVVRRGWGVRVRRS